jgi:ribonuclease D
LWKLSKSQTRKQSWLIDARAFKKNYRLNDPSSYDPSITPLLAIFGNPGILKVLHAAQGDQECLFTSFGVVASPTLDTAAAASLCGYGEGIGLSNLLKNALGISLMKGHSRTNWSVRPLPQQLSDYAHADVEHLVELAETLLDQLEKSGRSDWAFELSKKWEDPSHYQMDIEGTVQKLARGGKLDRKSYSALVELMKWREERVRELNLPRRWVADDQVLVNLSHVRPKDMEHLSAFRGLNKGELKNSGEAILAALRLGEEKTQQVDLPKRVKPLIPTPQEAQALELLKCFVGILANEHQIASKHLLNSSSLLTLLREHPRTIEELSQLNILNKSAIELIGDELIAIIQGQRSLRIEGQCRRRKPG